MESASRKSMHPLIATAAIAVIVFSAVGVAAIMGLIPTSKSKPEQVVTREVQPPVAAAPAPAVQKPSPPVARSAAPATPAPTRPAAQRAAAPIEPVRTPEPMAYPSQRDPARVAAAERPAPIPRPICVDCGTVESVREVKQAGEGSGVGAVAGGVAGAVVGRQIGGGRGRDLATIAGAVGGAVAGHQVEKHVKSGVVYEITVRMEDGSVRTLTESTPPTWRAGDRVRIQDGRLTTQS